MSSETKVSNGAGFHFPCNSDAIRCPADAIRCPADAILNGLSEEDVIKKNATKCKSYKSIMEYCNKAADELPQRQNFYAIDFADILWKVQEWKKCLPKVDIFYAVKANTDPVLLQLLMKLGLSFDCASGGEIDMVLKAGASPSNIIFAHTVKTVEEMKFASEKRVELMTFDSEEELLKINKVYPNAKLLIRIRPTSVKCLFDLSDKFGCRKEEAPKLLKLAKHLNLSVVGVSFHVGSLCTDPFSYTSTIRSSREVFDIAKDMGFSFSIVDIGGGFFGEAEKQHIFYTMAEGINKAFEESFGDLDVRYIAEPGTYIVGSGFRMVSTVLGKRCFDDADEGEPKRHYYINDGIYGSFFRGIDLYGIIPKPNLPESELQSRGQYESRVFGQTCCCEDVVLRHVTLPDMKVGERIVWENMGAYTTGVSSTFCGVPLAVSRYVFLKDTRLNLDWIDDKKTIINFLKSRVAFIGCTESEI